MLLFLPLGLILTGFTLPAALGGVESITWATFLNGKWAHPFEKKFTEELPVYGAARTFWGTTEYTLFNDGRSGVVIGKDGWLFTSEEFQTSRKAPQIYADHMSYIKDTATALAEKNIKLVVVLLPAKATMYTDKLGTHRYPASKAHIYSDTYEALIKDKIQVVDLLSLMSSAPDQFFLKTDTHWTQAGASATAKVVASRSRDARSVGSNKMSFQTIPAGEVIAHDGDLLRYLPVTSEIKTGLMQDRIGPLTTEPIATAEPAAGGEASLFGDETLDIVLVGTSYSANPLFNFAGALKEQIGADILNAADEGKGPFVTMKAWRENTLVEGASLPKVVIWEIPERYLTIADKI